MPKNTKVTKKQTRRTQVKELPKEAQKLSRDEQKKKGTGGGEGGWPGFNKKPAPQS